jgi:hypothetical protein
VARNDAFRIRVMSAMISALMISMLKVSPVQATDAKPPPVAPGTFVGTVGSAQVVMLIDTFSWRGAYFYTSVGRDIPLYGTAGEMYETDPSMWTNPDGKNTGRFSGSLIRTKTRTKNRVEYRGTWTSLVSGKQLPFSLLRSNETYPANNVATVTARIIKTKPEGGSGAGKAVYRFPVITKLQPKWVGTRITGMLQAQALFDETLEQAVAEFKPNGLGITGVDYKVPFNGRGLLNVELYSETLQAYPDHRERYMLFDLNSGAWMQANDLFWSRTKKSKVVALLQKQLDTRIDQATKGTGDDAITREQLAQSGKVTVDDDTLAAITISKSGVVFHHEFGFPHAIEALEPDGQLRLTWAELTPFWGPVMPFGKIG